MARVVIGICPQCGATLKIREHAARPSVRYTCVCGWAAAIAIDDALVARGEKLRQLRRLARHRQLANRLSRKWKRVAALLAIVSLTALCLAVLLPRQLPSTANIHALELLLYLCGIGCGVGVALSISALFDVERAMARGGRKKRRR